MLCPCLRVITAPVPKSRDIPGTSPCSVLGKSESGTKEPQQQTDTDLGYVF